MAVRISVYGTANMRQIERARKELDRLAVTAGASSRSAGAAMARLGASVSSAGGKMAAAGEAMTRNVTLPLVGLGVAGYKAIGMASDLAETTSKVGVVFGASAPAIRAWAATAATSLGQTQQQALDGAAAFAALGKGAGITGGELVTFSTKLVGLSADLASFANTTPEEALRALASGLRGEAEPLRAYGILLDDASMKAEALRIGLVKAAGDSAKIRAAQVAQADAQRAVTKAVQEHGKASPEAERAAARLGLAQARLKRETAGTVPELTQQQKVLARQSLIFGQSKDAQGDFQRTADGTANRLRIVTAQAKETATAFGDSLLPVVEDVIGVFQRDVLPAVTKAAAAFKGLDPATRSAIIGGAALVAVLGPVVTVLGRVTQAAGLMVSGIGKTVSGTVAAGRALVGFTAGLRATAAAQAATASKAMLMGGRVRAAAVAVGGHTVALVRNTAAALANGARTAWATAVTVGHRVASVASAAAARGLAAAQWVLNAAMSANPLGLVVLALVAVGVALAVAWRKSETFRAVVTGAWERVRVATRVAFEAVKSVVSTVWGWIGRAFQFTPVGFVVTHWTTIKDKTAGVFAAVKTAISTVWGWIAKAFQFTPVGFVVTHWATLKRATETAMGGIKAAIQWVVDKFSGLVSAARDMKAKVGDLVGGLKARITGVFSGAGEWLQDAGRKILGGLWDGVSDKVEWLLGKLRAVGARIASAFGLGGGTGRAAARGLGGGLDARAAQITTSGGAVGRALATQTNPVGYCERVVEQWTLGHSGVADDAHEGWSAFSSRRGYSYNPPPGVPVFYAGGAHGHVALSLGGGLVRSTDYPRNGVVGTGTIAGVGAHFGKSFLGWAGTFAGVPMYRDGGRVLGQGSGRSDSIPARLSAGEYVVNAAAAAEYGPLLDAINYGRRAGGSGSVTVAEGAVQVHISGGDDAAVRAAVDGAFQRLVRELRAR